MPRPERVNGWCPPSWGGALWVLALAVLAGAARPAEGQPLTTASAAVESEAANGSLSLRRTWRPSDTVSVTLPMSLRTERMPDAPDRVAVLYGPIVLAGALGTEGLPEGGAYAKDHLTYTGTELFIPDSLRATEGPFSLTPPPVASRAADAERVQEWVAPVEDEPLTFRTQGVGRPHDVTLRPFYEVHHQRYSVYWDLAAPEDRP